MRPALSMETAPILGRVWTVEQRMMTLSTAERERFARLEQTLQLVLIRRNVGSGARPVLGRYVSHRTEDGVIDYVLGQRDGQYWILRFELHDPERGDPARLAFAFSPHAAELWPDADLTIQRRAHASTGRKGSLVDGPRASAAALGRRLELSANDERCRLTLEGMSDLSDRDVHAFAERLTSTDDALAVLKLLRRTDDAAAAPLPRWSLLHVAGTGGWGRADVSDRRALVGELLCRMTLQLTACYPRLRLRLRRLSNPDAKRNERARVRGEAHVAVHTERGAHCRYLTGSVRPAGGACAVPASRQDFLMCEAIFHVSLVTACETAPLRERPADRTRVPTHPSRFPKGIHPDRSCEALTRYSQLTDLFIALRQRLARAAERSRGAVTFDPHERNEGSFLPVLMILMRTELDLIESLRERADDRATSDEVSEERVTRLIGELVR